MIEQRRTPIKCYRTPAGNNRVADWLRGLPVQERTDAEAFIRMMQKIPQSQWSPPHYRPRMKGCDGIGELRWYSGNKQYRLLGFFEDGLWCALVGCIHKQKIYSPADALGTAVRRKKQIDQGSATVVEYDF